MKRFHVPARARLAPAQEQPDWEELMASLHRKRDERRRREEAAQKEDEGSR